MNDVLSDISCEKKICIMKKVHKWVAKGGWHWLGIKKKNKTVVNGTIYDDKRQTHWRLPNGIVNDHEYTKEMYIFYHVHKSYWQYWLG